MEIYSSNEIYIRCAEKFLLARKQFCTKDDFLEIFQFNNQKYLINLLNVTLVDDNQIRSKELWQVIHSLDDAPMPYKDFAKDQIEFGSLSYLVEIYPNMNFIKSEGPDFVLKLNDEMVGLEVVSAGSSVEKQINRIATLNFGRNKSAKEVKNYIEKKHKNIRGKHAFFDFDGKIALSPYKDFTTSEELIERIIERINKKSKKSRKYTTYPGSWLLIDTEGNICFTEKHDADDLVKALIMIDNHLDAFSKIIVINRLHNVHMIYDTGRQEYQFHKQCNEGKL